MSFVAGVEKFALAVGSYGEDLPLIACGNIKRAVSCEREIPDVFRLGIEEYSFFTGS